jgi:hypothetical protein
MKCFNRETIKIAIKDTIKRMYQAQTESLDLYRNTLDCFSAVIDALIQNITLEQWIIQEKERQIQKTKQNAIGSLHEAIMCSIKGVYKADTLIDIESTTLKIIAEIKNKHNTTKGNHKVAIYKDLEKELIKRPKFTAYYVEILPKNQKTYNTPFTPSDNKTKTKLPIREDIRKIDGKSFYALLTGKHNAIEELYLELPKIVSEILVEEFSKTIDPKKIIKSDKFKEFFTKAYGEY